MREKQILGPLEPPLGHLSVKKQRPLSFNNAQAL